MAQRRARPKSRVHFPRKHIYLAVALPVFALMVGLGAYLSSVLFSAAFEGPSQSAGTGGGVIRSEGPNISIGTSSSPGVSRLYLAASSTSANDYAVRVVQPDGTVVFLVRNDQKVAIATSTPSGSTSTLIVAGNALITGALTAAVTYGQFNGTVSAVNVSGGYFGSQTGGGNYAFPASLSIATSTTPSGGVLFVNGNVGIGTASPSYTLDVNGTINATDVRVNGSSVGHWTLIRAASGTDTTSGSRPTFDSVNFSGLRPTDAVVVRGSLFVSGAAGQALSNPRFYHSTDGIELNNFNSMGSLYADATYPGPMTFDITLQTGAGGAPSSTKRIALIGSFNANTTSNSLNPGVNKILTTDWTSPWTLQFQGGSTGVSSGATVYWYWAVYKWSGL